MPIALESTYIENRALVQPDDTNNHDTAHGGNVAGWMDEVGAMSAMRFAGCDVVTASMRNIDFHAPIPRGDAALIRAFVAAAGRTSMDVALTVHAEDTHTAATTLTSDAMFTYVALDADGEPTAVPELDASSPAAAELLDRLDR
jgi:Acyl-CoA hydrolase